MPMAKARTKKTKRIYHLTWSFENFVEQFPNLIQHPVLKKWPYLPIKAKNFESTAHEIAQCILENDKRFGICG